MKVTSAPTRAAATDWFEPLPPGPSLKPEPMIVSPISGMTAGAEREVGDEDAEDGDAALVVQPWPTPLRPRRAG